MYGILITSHQSFRATAVCVCPEMKKNHAKHPERLALLDWTFYPQLPKKSGSEGGKNVDIITSFSLENSGTLTTKIRKDHLATIENTVQTEFEVAFTSVIQ